MVDEPNAVDKFMKDAGITGAFRGATDAVAKKVNEGTNGGIGENTVKSAMPWMAGGAAALVGTLLLQPIQWLVKGTFKALRNIVTLGGLLEEIPIIGGLFKALGDVIDTIGEYAGYVVPAIAAFIGYKAFQTEPTPEKPLPDKISDGLKKAADKAGEVAAAAGGLAADAAGKVADAAAGVAEDAKAVVPGTAAAIGVAAAIRAGATSSANANAAASSKQIATLRAAFDFDAYHQKKFGTPTTEGIDPRFTQEQATKLLRNVQETNNARFQQYTKEAATTIPKAGLLRAGLNILSSKYTILGPLVVGLPLKITDFIGHKILGKEPPKSGSVLMEKARDMARHRMQNDSVRSSIVDEVIQRTNTTDAPEPTSTPKSPATEPTASKPPLTPDTPDATAKPAAATEAPTTPKPNTPVTESSQPTGTATPKPLPTPPGTKPAMPPAEPLVATALMDMPDVPAGIRMPAGFTPETTSVPPEVGISTRGGPPSSTAIPLQAEVIAPAGSQPPASAPRAPTTAQTPAENIALQKAVSEPIRDTTRPATPPSDAPEAKPTAAKAPAAKPNFWTGGPRTGFSVAGGSAAMLGSFNVINDENASTTAKVVAGTAGGAGTAQVASELAGAKNLARNLGRVAGPLGVGIGAFDAYGKFTKENATTEDYLEGGISSGYAAGGAMMMTGVGFVPGAVTIIGTGVTDIGHKTVKAVHAISETEKIKEQMDRLFTPSASAAGAYIAINQYLLDTLKKRGVPTVEMPGGGEFVDIRQDKDVFIIQKTLEETRDAAQKKMDENNNSWLPRFMKPTIFGFTVSESLNKQQDAFEDARSDVKRYEQAIAEMDAFKKNWGGELKEWEASGVPTYKEYKMGVFRKEEQESEARKKKSADDLRKTLNDFLKDDAVQKPSAAPAPSNSSDIAHSSSQPIPQLIADLAAGKTPQKGG